MENHHSHVTIDHDIIRHWAEERGGHPASVKNTGSSKDVGMLRIDFEGYSGDDSLREITWDAFFEKFDEKKLAFVYQDETAAGQKSNFNKLVSRSSVKDQIH